MKLSSKVTLVALALSASLAACGGKATFDVAGSITGLSNDGLILATDGQTISPAAGAVSFSFPNQIDYGTDYNVTIQQQPQHMTCSITNGSGSAGHTTAIVAAVACVQNAYTLGGTISGLTVAGLELANGSATTILPAADSTTFVFPETVQDGKSYGITVLTQPPGLTCTVTNGTGVMGEAAITSVAVTCEPNPS